MADSAVVENGPAGEGAPPKTEKELKKEAAKKAKMEKFLAKQAKMNEQKAKKSGEEGEKKNKKEKKEREEITYNINTPPGEKKGWCLLLYGSGLK